jgi:hypothetical protein
MRALAFCDLITVMAQDITFLPINIVTPTVDTDGRLALVDDRLAAVLVRLQDEIHGEGLQGTWFVEAAFGALDGKAYREVFHTLEEVADWIRRCLPSCVDRDLAGNGRTAKRSE